MDQLSRERLSLSLLHVPDIHVSNFLCIFTAQLATPTRPSRRAKTTTKPVTRAASLVAANGKSLSSGKHQRFSWDSVED